MKMQNFLNKYKNNQLNATGSPADKWRKGKQGSITLEMLIAMALIVLSISATLPLVSKGQSVSVDSQTNQEALYKAHELLENIDAISRSDFASVATSEPISDGIYQNQIIVDQASITQCGKNVKSNVAWTIDNRPLKIELISHFGNLETAKSLGGNCDFNPPSPGWNNPDTWASSNFNLGLPTSIDVLNRIVYMTSDENPKNPNAVNFHIADTNGVEKGINDGLFIAFKNNFKANAKLNDIKVARLSDGKTYAFVAKDTKTNQFQIIDVSDIYNPISKGVFQLADVHEDGSYPQAWRIYYYHNKAYVTTRYTEGPELHIFDVSDPTNIHQLGSGINLGLTVNDFVVTEKHIGDVSYTFAYMATSSDSKELLVLDVTSPLNVIEVQNATRNLTNPNYADGNAVFLIGNNLYFGRDSSSQDDLYIFDATNPITAVDGLPIIQSADIGASVIALAVSGPYIFMSTAKANARFQVWTSDPANSIIKVDDAGFKFPNIVASIKYENGLVYVAGQSDDSLRILYNNP